MIVIVATSNDPAIGPVIEALERLGRSDVLWLDLETAMDDIVLESRIIDGKMRWNFRSEKRPDSVCSPETISAVYWRRPVSYLGSPFLGIPTSANLDAVEIFWSIRWHLESLPASRFPLGHPWVFARAENKHRQMEVAGRLGFRLPETLHSNDPGQLAGFARGHSSVALKALRMPAVSTSGEVQKARHISCRAFDGEQLAGQIAGRDRCQLYCQEAVARKRDWRITVLPNQTICAEIDTSPLEGNKLDWREHSLELPHRIVELEPSFDRQLRAFLSEMELTSGYFDFAVPEEGPPVFFECNTNAQWLWIQQVTGHPIAEAIARELMLEKVT
jgi:hypothetical protein